MSNRGLLEFCLYGDVYDINLLVLEYGGGQSRTSDRGFQASCLHPDTHDLVILWLVYGRAVSQGRQAASPIDSYYKLHLACTATPMTLTY